MVGVPQIDYTKVEFPSDGLTIKTLRRIHPEQVDTGNEIDLFSKPLGGKAGEFVFSMLQMERDLARAAFNQVLGRETSIPYADDDPNLVAEDLGELYSRYGIADGPNTAKQLIRGIESQATAQARQFLPPRP